MHTLHTMHAMHTMNTTNTPSQHDAMVQKRSTLWYVM